MTEILNRLSELKEQIESDKQEFSEAKAELKFLMKQLEDKFGIKSLKAAEQKIKALQKKEDELEKKIEKELSELENEYFQE